jgi:LysM repeat protein
MDTISRENNSMLPAIGVAVGAVALLLAAYSAITLGKVKATVAAHEEKLSHLDDIASQASAASTKADAATANLSKLHDDTQKAFNEVAASLGTIQASLAKLEETRKAPAMGKGGSHAGPAVAGPGEYVVKPGDSLAKIARANGVSLSDLQSVNPGVDSKHLKPGQKLKLPQKGAAAAAPAAAAPAAQ